MPYLKMDDLFYEEGEPKPMCQKPFIIGIAGRARSGKDTIAEHLVYAYDFERFAFATPIKEIVNPMFGWDARHRDGELKEVDDPFWGFSPRKAYQLFGTEFGRALNPNLWVLFAERRLQSGLWVCSDVRFDNEANFVRKHGFIIHVERPGVKPVNAHVSEEPIMMESTDYHILNDGPLGQLYNAVNLIMEDHRYGEK